MPVIVATKVLRYGRKDQQPGDSFEASEKDAKLLCLIGKARLSNASPPKSVDLPKEVMSRAPKPEPAPTPVEVDDITTLRETYMTTVGKRPFNGWSAEELKDKIGQYNRRDMRAQD